MFACHIVLRRADAVQIPASVRRPPKDNPPQIPVFRGQDVPAALWVLKLPRRPLRSGSPHSSATRAPLRLHWSLPHLRHLLIPPTVQLSNTNCLHKLYSRRKLVTNPPSRLFDYALVICLLLIYVFRAFILNRIAYRFKAYFHFFTIFIIAIWICIQF